MHCSIVSSGFLLEALSHKRASYFAAYCSFHSDELRIVCLDSVVYYLSWFLVFEFPFYEGECEEDFTSRPKLEAL